MCKFKITKIWLIRKLIRKVAPSLLPIDFEVEDVVVKATNYWYGDKTSTVLKLVEERDYGYLGEDTDGVAVTLYKNKELHIEVLDIIKKEHVVPISCKISEKEFKKRLEESAIRCANSYVGPHAEYRRASIKKQLAKWSTDECSR